MSKGESDFAFSTGAAAICVVKSVASRDEFGECRICKDVDRADQMMSPCRCSGSMKYIHYDCLVRCVHARDSPICDICCTQYRDIVTRTDQRSFGEFLNMNAGIRNEFIVILSLFFLLQLTALVHILFKLSSSIENKLAFIAQLLFHFVTLGFYLFFEYCSYLDWAQNHMKVTVIGLNNSIHSTGYTSVN